MNLQIRHKLYLGFGAVIALMLVSSTVAYLKLNQMHVTQSRVTEVRQPTRMATRDLAGEVTRSLAALRGYIILGNDPAKARQFRDERADAWSQMNATLARIQQLAGGDVDGLGSLQRELTALHAAQDEVEAISQTDDNIPAFKILLTDATPLAEQMIDAVNAVIEEEGRLEATPDRKRTLAQLSDAKGAFAVGLASLRAYLLSGEPAFRAGFDRQWAVNADAVAAVSNRIDLLTDTQRDHWQDFVKQREAFAKLADQMFALRTADDWNLANHWLATRAAPRIEVVDRLLETINQQQDELAARDTERLASASRTVTLTLILTTLTASVLAAVIALLLSRQLVGSIRTLNLRLRNIAEGDGDLTQRVDTTRRDELGSLGESFNAFIGRVHDLICDAASVSGEVRTAARQIAATTDQMAQGMARQRDQTAQVSAGIEEMSTTVAHVADQTTRATTSASSAGQQAADGGRVVQETVASIHGIAEVVNESARAIDTLGHRAQAIGEIIDVINNIADQTNLLALNAAIEAARAGEHGRGFAVVADEVRKLAERTSTATEEVDRSIRTIQTETEAVVKRMSEGTAKVDQGVACAQQAGEALGRIVNGSSQVADLIRNIAASAEEQSHAARHISENVESISGVTRQSADGAAHMADATVQLNRKSEALDRLIASFKVDPSERMGDPAERAA